MRVLVHAASLASAGGLSVALNFLREAAAAPNVDIHAVVPGGVGYEALTSPSLRLTTLSRLERSAIARPVLEHVVLPRLARQFRAEAVFAMGNIALPLDLPQLLLFHWAYAVYPEAEVWRRMRPGARMRRRLRRVAFEHRLRYATAVAVQTETVRIRFQGHYRDAPPLFVVPNAVPEAYRTAGATGAAVGSDERGTSTRIRETRRRPRRFLCFTRYYVHKNLEVLLAVGERLRERELPLCIVLTISPNQDRRAAKLLREIERRRLGDWIVNHGPVEQDAIASLYEDADALLLPTLLESFSGTYVEAMAFGKPILTSDRDFARDVCGEAAAYFDPTDPEAIVAAMTGLARSPRRVDSLVEAGRRRLSGMPGWRSVTRTYLDLLAGLAHGRVGGPA